MFTCWLAEDFRLVKKKRKIYSTCVNYNGLDFLVLTEQFVSLFSVGRESINMVVNSLTEGDNNKNQIY